jgi:hypothetical protein
MTERKAADVVTKLAVLLYLICDQSSAFARGAVRDDPWNPDHIDRLPTEVRNSVLRMCRERPRAGHYFATYLENSKIIRLHFELFSCDEGRSLRQDGACLRQEFVSDGSRYRHARTYYDRCDD